MEIGFMQGRLSEPVEGKIQAFPWRHWRYEFAEANRLGFSVMEWTLDSDKLYENPLMTSEGRQQIYALSEKYAVRISSLTGDCFMQTPFYKETGECRERLLSDFRNVVIACAELGIQYVVVPLVDHGRLENDAQEISLLDGLETIVPLLREGMKILFESDFPPQRLVGFIGRLPAEHFGVNYDIGNSAAMGYDPVEEIAAYGSRIYNVHVKDRLLGGITVPLGTGNADFMAVFYALKQVGYHGHYILQTARAVDGDHSGVLCRYREMVRDWLSAV